MTPLDRRGHPRSGEIEGRIFVVGVPRSGTTLVQGLLATHSRVTSFTESHFLSRHFRLTPLIGAAVLVTDPTPRLREFLDENVTDPADRVAVLDAYPVRVSRIRPAPLRTRAVARTLLGVLDRLALGRGCPVWVEKTPQHLRYLPFLERVGEGPVPLHFVHVIRDGLEVVTSLYHASRRWDGPRPRFAQGALPPYDLDACVNRWNRDLRFSLGRVASLRDHFVFYEDLTADPEGTLRPLCARLGLAWEPDILTEHAQTARQLVGPGEAWKRIDPRIRGRERSADALTPDQRARVDRALRLDLYRELYQRARARSPFASAHVQ